MKPQEKKKETPTADARRLALDTLCNMEAAGQYSNLSVDRALKNTELSPEDRGLFTRLCYGVLERAVTLDHIVSHLTDRRDLEPEVRMILRMGLYQLYFMNRIPDHAAVFSSVELAPKRAAGFVNAVLRSALRSGKDWFLPDAKEESVPYLSVKFGIPTSLCSRFLDVFGFEKTERIFEGFDTVPPVTVRVNTLKITRDAYLDRLTRAGYRASSSDISPVGIRVTGKTDGGDIGSVGSPMQFPGFDEGLFFVQDEASQICTCALGAEEGDTVADTCACPGSKSFGIAADLGNTGRVYSFDLHENKLSLVRTGAKRLGITVLDTAARDARNPDPALFGKCDKVLCDVPCSGFGVLAKKPEIRHKNPAETDALPAIQSAILAASAQYVRPGGVLVYSTCTVFPQENEDNIRAFLSTHPDFSLSPFSVGTLDVPNGMLTLTPDLFGTDGFFIARLQKRG